MATLIVFAKLPASGKVKTRLAPVLGALGAAQLAEAFLLDLTERLALSLDSKIACVLCFDPPDAELEFRRLLASLPGVLTRFQLVPQSGGGLGERLANALTVARKTFSAPYIFIGTDAPDLSVKQIEYAAELTTLGPACITPADDGGYVLLALPDEAPPDVFEQIEWSTRETAAQQMRQLSRCGIGRICSEPWPDVDEPGDLPALFQRLEANPTRAPRTLQFLQSLARIESD